MHVLSKLFYNDNWRMYDSTCAVIGQIIVKYFFKKHLEWSLYNVNN